MNIQAQCCGLAILFCIHYFYLHQRKIGLKSETIFNIFLWVTTFGIVFDILSILVIRAGNVPQPIIDLVGKIYVILLICAAYSAIMYLLADFYMSNVLRIYNYICIAVAVIGSIITFLLPIKFYVTEKYTYSYGPATFATYIFCFAAFLFMGFCIIKFRKRIVRVRRNAMLVWLSIFILAAAVQFIFPEQLLVGFSGALSIMIIYLVLENPEANIDKNYGCFNSHAFSLYLAEKYFQGDKFYLCIVTMVVDLEDANYIGKATKFFHAFLKQLSTFRKIRVFKMSTPEIIIASSDKQEIEQVLSFIKRTATKLTNDYKLNSPFFVYMPDSTVVQNNSELISILETLKVDDTNRYDSNDLILIDADFVAKVRREEEIAHIIRTALDEDRVEIFLQPIYSIKKRIFVSAEVLVRIRMPDGSILYPDAFIPIAEKNGSILQIGNRVFEKACQFLEENKNLLQLGFEYLEVNLSGVQCGQENLTDEFMDILTGHNISPSMINLEITETASIKIKTILLRNMKQMIEKGITFSLDDFGSGRSNLNYLAEMPIAIVKFDQSVTQSFLKHEKTHRITTDVVRMLHNLNLKVVAEGVETKAQLDAMQILGIDYIQGYYFSKPLPVSEFLKFLENPPVSRDEEYDILEVN